MLPSWLKPIRVKSGTEDIRFGLYQSCATVKSRIKECDHAPIGSARLLPSDIAALASAYYPSAQRARRFPRLLDREDPQQAQHHRNFRFTA
jgi:hypothetical protein